MPCFLFVLLINFSPKKNFGSSVRQAWWQKSLVAFVALIKYTEEELKGLSSCLATFACFKHFLASLKLFTLGTSSRYKMKLFPWKCHGFYSVFLSFPPPIREMQLSGFVGR